MASGSKFFRPCFGCCAPVLLRKPLENCLRAVRHGPHFVLKHETTIFSSGCSSRGQLRKYGNRPPGKGLCPLHSRKPFKKGLILNF